MTSTSFNVGLKEGKSSSRVLRPPGGGHTDIFGGEPDPPKVGKRGLATIQHELANGNSNSNSVPEKVEDAQPAMPEVPEAAEAPEAPVREAIIEPAKEDPQAIGDNPQVDKIDIQKEEMESKPTKPETKIEPPKRVRVPPGGFSSGLW